MPLNRGAFFGEQMKKIQKPKKKFKTKEAKRKYEAYKHINICKKKKK